MATAVNVNLIELVLLLSATEVAVIVAVQSALSEASNGGAKVAAVLEVGVMVPQPVLGETLQLTPPLLVSLETAAVRVTDGSPALMVVDDALLVNDVLTGVAGLLLLPQPLSISNKKNRETNTARNVFRMLVFIRSSPHLTR